ncbi:Hypothetical protein FKW44_004261, partial [Caligus rogercresseyi]
FYFLNSPNLRCESSNAWKGIVLFGLGKNNKSPESKALTFSILNSKALICQKLSFNEPLHPFELRNIF